MADVRADPSLRTYIRVIRRRKWWVVGTLVVGLLASLAISLIMPKQYSTTAEVLVQSTSTLGGPPQPVTLQQVQTMLLLVTSAPVEQAVRRQLGGLPDVAVAESAQTNMINITATSPRPFLAALIANAYARAFVTSQQTLLSQNQEAAQLRLQAQINSITKQINQLTKRPGAAARLNALANQQSVLQQQLAQLQVNGATSAASVLLVTPAQPPVAPSSPRPVQNVLLGSVAGLLLGFGLAFLWDNLDDAVSTQEQAEQFGRAPVLTAVPVVSAWRKRENPLVISLARPASRAAEAYRSLRTSVRFASADRDLKTILVTSSNAEEGKTSTLANLATVFGKAGYRVLMVSCDLRKPQLGKFFRIDESVGFTSAILHDIPVTDLVQPVPDNENVWLLPSGPVPPNPAELLSSARAQRAFAQLRQAFDLVLIDSPPVLPVTDAVMLAKEADATLLIVATRQTKSGDLRRAAEKLAQVDAKVLGIVLNETTKHGGSYGYGYGSYHHGYYAERPEADKESPGAVQPAG